ncbi:hypothetical protein RB195_000827 [Necator americanus]|uniref:BPTI/Kunitz inhibitor domain-containing protein n=1 Tax=Necator americanus TaxID=51031 RepID=A0ABR1DEH7_NECAM
MISAYFILCLLAFATSHPKKRCLENVDHCLVLYQPNLKEKFFYNTHSKKCMSAMMTKCEGKRNRFDSLELCQRACKK